MKPKVNHVPQFGMCRTVVSSMDVSCRLLTPANMANQRVLDEELNAPSSEG